MGCDRAIQGTEGDPRAEEDRSHFRQRQIGDGDGDRVHAGGVVNSIECIAVKGSSHGKQNTRKST